MKYFVYFDSYGRAKGAINEDELAEKYSNDPDQYLRKMCGLNPDAGIELTSGHVGTLRFDNEKELKEYLEAGGDEITGFYEGQSGSRPYNF
ncbi:MAG: hypothetical protein PVG99_04330 [Desulfobacteraceae bacterium]|jgi:hypothetical protein